MVAHTFNLGLKQVEADRFCEDTLLYIHSDFQRRPQKKETN